MDEVLVADSETDGLLDEVTKVHMLQMGTLDGDDVTIYLDPKVPEAVIETAREQGMVCAVRPLKEGVERLREASMSYWHNWYGYDQHILDRFFPGTVTRAKARDSLVMARLAHPHQRDNSLEAWGNRVGTLKGDFKGPWGMVTPEMLVYSAQDVVVGRKLVKLLLGNLKGQERPMETEHAVAYWINQMERTGFTLDIPLAERIYTDLLIRKRELERELRVTFKPRWVSDGLFIPRASHGPRGYTKGVEMTKVVWDEFSPGSLQGIARRLQEKGWKPAEFTKTGQVKVDAEVLSGLVPRFPEAAGLAEYLRTCDEAATVGGDSGWLKLVKSDGRIHGRVNTIGAYTQRMSHSKPNMTTPPKHGEFRKCFKARDGWKLVGVDGEGIQARVVGHYLSNWDGGAFGDRCVNGNSDLGTDIHSANRDAILHCFPEAMRPTGVEPGHPVPSDEEDSHKSKPTRGPSKNILYAIFFGAQDPRLAMTLKDGCIKARVNPPRIPNRELGASIRRGLEKSMTGLSKLTDLVERTFDSRKHLVGLDGRKLHPPSKRNAFVTLIQAGEAVIMKTALVIFADGLAVDKGWAYERDYAFVANVHDEVQIECREEIAIEVGATFAAAIHRAGITLNMKCAQQGKATIGNNWHETH